MFALPAVELDPEMLFQSLCSVGVVLGDGLGKLGMGSSAGYDLELTQI